MRGYYLQRPENQANVNSRLYTISGGWSGLAGPILYQVSPKKENKAYLVLYGCSLTRAVHLDLVKSLETNYFLASLKRFIARRGILKLLINIKSYFPPSEVEKIDFLLYNQTEFKH